MLRIFGIGGYSQDKGLGCGNSSNANEEREKELSTESRANAAAAQGLLSSPYGPLYRERKGE